MRPPVRIPPPVRPGATVRVISPTGPSAALLADRARRGERALAASGFAVDYAPYALETSSDGLTAGDARLRAEDLMTAFEDPAVGAILCADAGSRSRDLLEHLDPARIAPYPKPFIGFCDNVFLNQYLASTAGLASLYGCTLIPHLGETGGAFPETLTYLVAALDSAAPLRCEPVGPRTGEWINWYLPESEQWRRRRTVPGAWTWLRPGRAGGPLLGGEISVLPALVRTFGLDLSGAVLFWHRAFRDTDPEQRFRDLCAAADLTALAAMVVGAHPTIPPPQWAARVADLLDEQLPGCAYPVVVNAAVDHLSPLWTVPFAEEVVVAASDGITFPRAQSEPDREGRHR